MVQKIIDVVGISKKSFDDAAANAVAGASKTVYGLKWARVDQMEMRLDEKKVLEYRVTVHLYFDVER